MESSSFLNLKYIFGHESSFASSTILYSSPLLDSRLLLGLSPLLGSTPLLDLNPLFNSCPLLSSSSVFDSYSHLASTSRCSLVASYRKVMILSRLRVHLIIIVEILSELLDMPKNAIRAQGESNFFQPK